MSVHDEIRTIVEDMLHAGVVDRDAIVEAASRNVEVPPEEMRRVYFTKAVSLEVTKVRDDDNNRLMYQMRDGGRSVVVDIRHTNNAALVRKIGNMKIRKGTAEVRDGERLVQIAEQIEINFAQAA